MKINDSLMQDSNLLSMLRQNNEQQNTLNSDNVQSPASVLQQDQQEAQTARNEPVKNTQELDSALNKHSRNLIDITA